MRKKYFIVLSLLSLFAVAFSSFAESGKEKLTAEKFLYNLRASHPVNTWADMQGDIIQKKRLKSGDYKTSRAKIKVGILFTKVQAVAMIKLNVNNLNSEDSEIYKVGQPYNGKESSVISSNLGDSSLIGNYGISPSDFTMSFLWWDLAKCNNDSLDSVKGLKCRVLNLENPKTQEKLKVYASINYYYPLKVEWFKKDSKVAYRTMLINSFERDGDLGAPNSIIISGPGWKTKVDFEDVNLGYSKDGISKTLFK